MVETPKIKIEIDHQRYSNMLSLISQIALGESSPLFLEERVRELQEIIPFLPKVISWMAVAMDYVSEAKDRDVGNNPEALRNFLLHNDMLCRAEGALAALLCVAEDLRAQEKRESEKPKKRKRGVPKGPEKE